MHADALATALTVLGPEAGLAYRQRGMAWRRLFVDATQDGFMQPLHARLRRTAARA